MTELPTKPQESESNLEAKLIAAPEFQELKDVVEKTLYHFNERVYDHVLLVLKNLKEILERINPETAAKLSEKIGARTRKELLIIATVLHDISKTECIVVKEDGTTRCSGHEEAGAKKAIEILKRFGLSEAELGHISAVIEAHAVTDAIFTADNQISEADRQAIKEKYAAIYIELILLTYADAMSEYTRVSRPEEYQLKSDFYQKELQDLR